MGKTRSVKTEIWWEKTVNIIHSKLSCCYNKEYNVSGEIPAGKQARKSMPDLLQGLSTLACLGQNTATLKCKLQDTCSVSLSLSLSSSFPPFISLSLRPSLPSSPAPRLSLTHTQFIPYIASVFSLGQRSLCSEHQLMQTHNFQALEIK